MSPAPLSKREAAIAAGSGAALSALESAPPHEGTERFKAAHAAVMDEARKGILFRLEFEESVARMARWVAKERPEAAWHEHRWSTELIVDSCGPRADHRWPGHPKISWEAWGRMGLPLAPALQSDMGAFQPMARLGIAQGSPVAALCLALGNPAGAKQWLALPGAAEAWRLWPAPACLWKGLAHCHGESSARSWITLAKAKLGTAAGWRLPGGEPESVWDVAARGLRSGSLGRGLIDLAKHAGFGGLDMRAAPGKACGADLLDANPKAKAAYEAMELRSAAVQAPAPGRPKPRL